MYDSSAVARFRRSLFSAAAFAFPFVFWNLGIAIAAKIPMITTTISSSISVKPFLSARWSTILHSWGWYTTQEWRTEDHKYVNQRCASCELPLYVLQAGGRA